jgi:hypothetical protein
LLRRICEPKQKEEDNDYNYIRGTLMSLLFTKNNYGDKNQRGLEGRLDM